MPNKADKDTQIPSNAFIDPIFWKDIGKNLPQALAGSAAGTLGLPVDLYKAVMSMAKGNFIGGSEPDVPGSSDWIGRFLGADPNNQSFDIARMTAMAPPAVGVLGGTANKALKAIPAAEDDAKFIQELAGQLIERAHAWEKAGGDAQAAIFYERARNFERAAKLMGQKEEIASIKGVTKAPSSGPGFSLDDAINNGRGFRSLTSQIKKKE